MKNILSSQKMVIKSYNFLFSVCLLYSYGLIAQDLPKPTPEQIKWADAGIGLFIHWGPNVYQGKELDEISTPLNKINPDKFNASQIAKAAVSAHAGYLIFVAKHAGGYCCWQTNTTPYSIKSSPWKKGKGDMVAELAAACKKENLKFGIYLCPRDIYNNIKDRNIAIDSMKQKETDVRYRQQLKEILTNYGPLFEIWFDGGGVVTPTDDIFDKYAPGIIQFQGVRKGGTRWVGTENGFAPYPCWNTATQKTPTTVVHPQDMNVDGNVWCPAECDVSILRPDWFWHKDSDKKILSLADLIEIYYLSVGRGVNLLLNITPDDHGAIPPLQIQRLEEFGNEIETRFAKPLATASGKGDSLILSLQTNKKTDHIVLREDIKTGEHVRAFTVEALQPDGNWKMIYKGLQIANRQVIPFTPITTSSLRLTILEKAAPVSIREFSAYYVNKPVPQNAYRIN